MDYFHARMGKPVRMGVIEPTGYFTPDYVWVVPKGMREETKRFFERLSSTEIRSPVDFERIIREIG